MKKTLLTIILSSLCAVIPMQAQQETYFSGLLLNDSAYAQIPQKPALLTRSYEALPAAHSLKPYCPATKSQGSYGTCTGWATAYAARTIAEAAANGWQESSQITGEAFSPLFVYALIKDASDVNCQKGAYLHSAFEILKTKGDVKYRDFNSNCPSSIPDELYSKALPHAIDNYFTLFPYGEDSYAKKINTTKKAIAENRPVVISMASYTSFHNSSEEVWSGTADYKRGYHAMCVVAYDDNQYGGAFLLMNSWGSYWGDKGFKWVRYADYSRHVNYAIEMYVRKKNVPPAPVPPVPPVPPQPKPEPVDLSGELHFVLSTGQEMLPHLHTLNNIPYYKLEGSYISGTRYRLYLSNDEPAYVYVIGSDLKNSVTKVFPPNERISAALVYKSNDIAIPDEKWHIVMDNTPGKDYACVLYSRDELPVDAIVAKMKAESGSFFEKVYKVLADKIVPAPTVHYDLSTIKFSVKNTEKIVVPVIVEIEHR